MYLPASILTQYDFWKARHISTEWNILTKRWLFRKDRIKAFSRHRLSSAPVANAPVAKSSRSPNLQARFRTEVMATDGVCLLTGERDLDSLEACHIVPFDLGQSKLDEICGPMLMRLYAPSNGLLLTPTQHAAFDRSKWSIYFFDGSYFVHVFGETDHKFQGKRLKFRTRRRIRLPRRELLDWHCSQCLMARSRGYITDYGF